MKRVMLQLAFAGFVVATPVSADDLEKVVADYVGLYRRETLSEWKKLFLPSFTVASTQEDGGVRTRSLEEFFEAQKRYFESGREIREVLESVRIDRQGKLASVWANFVLTDEGVERHGKLVLLLIEEAGHYKIHSLMFSYG